MTTDLIQRFLNSLTDEGLRDCRKRINEMLRRSPGRPPGRSKTAYHQACHSAALAVLSARRKWLEEHQNKKRWPPNFLDDAIQTEIDSRPELKENLKAFDAVKRRVDKPVRNHRPIRKK